MKRKTLIVIIIAGLLVWTLILVFTLVVINNKKRDDLYASFPAKLESYYEKNGTYPMSLAQLEGVALGDVAKGSELIYRVRDKSGRNFYSYDAKPASDDASVIMCYYEIDFQTTDSFGLNPKIADSLTNNHCQ